MSEKIKLTDSILDVMVKMSGGNPGAATVCGRLLKEEAAIDPDCALGGLGAILGLDTLGLYGSKIWQLYKDVCDEDLVKTCAVLRGWQLGYVAQSDIYYAIDNRGEGIDCDAILAQVKERLPNFGNVVVIPDN